MCLLHELMIETYVISIQMHMNSMDLLKSWFYPVIK